MKPFIAVCDDSFIAAYKPPRMHSVPLRSDEEGSLLHWCAARYPEILAVQGQKTVEGGALHRLDYETRGLVLFARTQKALDYFRAEQKAGRFVKTYTAETAKIPRTPPAGFPPKPDGLPLGGGSIESGFRHYGPGRREVRPVADGDLYRTAILAVEEAANLRWTVSLTRGFRHQIRCHLAWLGYPILGDALYGGSIDSGFSKAHPPNLCLTATELHFIHPTTGKPVTVG
jgi:23S rRNA pseudouridine1911/1915/1917 synthase